MLVDSTRLTWTFKFGALHMRISSKVKLAIPIIQALPSCPSAMISWWGDITMGWYRWGDIDGVIRSLWDQTRPIAWIEWVPESTGAWQLAMAFFNLLRRRGTQLVDHFRVAVHNNPRRRFALDEFMPMVYVDDTPPNLRLQDRFLALSKLATVPGFNSKNTHGSINYQHY